MADSAAAEEAAVPAFDPPARGEGAPEEMDVEALRKEVARLSTQNTQLLEAKAALEEKVETLEDEVETLKTRCQKMARAAAQDGEASAAADGAAEARIPPMVLQMLQSPKDEEVQVQGIDKLFAQQTQAVDAATPAANQAALEAAVAILRNHPGNSALLLKASQFLSVLLAEPGVQQQLPLSVIFAAAREVVCMSDRLLAQAAAGSSDGTAATKLLTWFLMLLASIFPCLSSHLRDRGPSEEVVLRLLNQLIGPLLASADLPQEAAMLKCVNKCMALLPLLPTEPWIQKACLDSGAVHSLVLAFHRCTGNGTSNAQSESMLTAFRAALKGIFTENPELCVQAMGDAFVSDEFVCLEVLGELRSMTKDQAFCRTLDKKWGVVEKALGLWAFHQRRLLEAADPQKCSSREVLQRVAELLSVIMGKLTASVLLQRMKDFPTSEPLQRLALATLSTSPQLRLQLAVNYEANDLATVVINCLQMLLRRFEVGVDADSDSNRAAGAEVEKAFRLLEDEKLPAEGWMYVEHSLDICLHILSHWSAAKLSLPQKGVGPEGLHATAAPLLLAQGGLVDVLAELIDCISAGIELVDKVPTKVYNKAVETLQNLFEQSAHVCLFCMQHYQEVKLVISTASDSLAIDPLANFPEMQQQAVEQLANSFEKFAEDKQLVRKVLKALAALFESSHSLVGWFLETHSLADLGELQALDLHVEACRAVARVPYWSIEEAPELPRLVTNISQLLLGSIEGLTDASDASKPRRRVLDLNEAEEVVSSCGASLLQLLLIDPSPPTVSSCLVKSLSAGSEEDVGAASEAAVNNIMKVMQVFPSSNRVQMNCQHLLTSLLG